MHVPSENRHRIFSENSYKKKFIGRKLISEHSFNSLNRSLLSLNVQSKVLNLLTFIGQRKQNYQILSNRIKKFQNVTRWFVSWYDSRFGSERSRVQFPNRPELFFLEFEKWITFDSLRTLWIRSKGLFWKKKKTTYTTVCSPVSIYEEFHILLKIVKTFCWIEKVFFFCFF